MISKDNVTLMMLKIQLFTEINYSFTQKTAVLHYYNISQFLLFFYQINAALVRRDL